MKNFEKHIDEIVCYFANSNCFDIDCAKCIFNKSDVRMECIALKDNSDKLKEWLLEECVEQSPLSNDEYVILNNIEKKYKWIARDYWNSNLYVYDKKPTKKCNIWDSKGDDLIGIRVFNHMFKFIKWEDEEPYEIAKLIDDYETENKDE